MKVYLRSPQAESISDDVDSIPEAVRIFSQAMIQRRGACHDEVQACVIDESSLRTYKVEAAMEVTLLPLEHSDPDTVQ